jgi:hypothetical protein
MTAMVVTAIRLIVARRWTLIVPQYRCPTSPQNLPEGTEQYPCQPDPLGP